MKKDRLLEFYLLGFNDEINFSNVPKDDMLQNAYKLGKKHSAAGDKIESTEYLNDDIVEFLIKKETL